MSLSLVDADFFLEENKFKQYCTEFLQYSQRIGDDWQWRSIKDSTDGYMSKTHFQLKNRSISSGRVDIVNDEPTFLSVEEGLDDSQEAGVSEVSEVIRYEYHVLYSCSYQAPVLYFRASFLDGKPLTLDDIWKSVHECYTDRLWQGPWDTITQQSKKMNLLTCGLLIERHLLSFGIIVLSSMGIAGSALANAFLIPQEHPLLGQPFFVLHPCRTNEFMSSILSNLHKQKKHTNYIISWLSVVGPVVGLHLPLSYAKANLEETEGAD